MNISFYVNHQVLSTHSTPFVVSDTINYIIANFNFLTEDWNDLVKVAHISDGTDNFDLILNNNTATFNLTSGNWELCVSGHKYVDNVLQQRITTSIYKFEVVPTGELNGEPIPISPPSLGEQILGDVERAIDISENAIDIAMSVREEADAGVFRGEAAHIRVGTTTTTLPGTNASVSNSGTSTNAVLEFRIPKGEQGIPGNDANVTQENVLNAIGYTPANSAETVNVNEQVLTAAQQDTARENINAEKKHGTYELIETIIVGYSLTTSEPADWVSNYTAYYTNTGTLVSPIYTAVTGASAPTWTAGTYYNYDSAGVSSIDLAQDPYGAAYNFDDVLIKTRTTASSAAKPIYYYAYHGENSTMGFGQNHLQATITYGVTRFENVHGFIVGVSAAGGSNPAGSVFSAFYLTPYNGILTVASPIDKITISVLTGVIIPSNSKFEIWGVRHE